MGVRYDNCMRTQLPRGSDVSAAWSQVATLASAMDANLDKWLTDTYRLGLTEYRALAFLSQSPDKELRVAALAERTGLNASSTTRLVSRLEAKGLARRDVCTDDGRGVYAVIDEPGENLLREARKPYEARVEDLLRRLSTHMAHLDPRAVADALTGIATLVKP